MGQVHADPEELRRIARQQRAFMERLRDRHDRLLAMLSRLNDSWRDQQFKEFAEEVTHDLNQLREAASQIEMMAGRIEQLALPLEDYLSEGLDSGVSEVQYKSGDELSSPPPPPPAGKSSGSKNNPLNDVTSDQEHSLTLLSVADLSMEDIEWGRPDFENTFKTETHHGYTGEDYLEFVSHLPEVIEHVKEGGNLDAWSSGSTKRACHSAFFRKQVIRLDRTPEGKIDVIEGRHRLYACLQRGIDPPVSWAGTNDDGSSTSAQ